MMRSLPQFLKHSCLLETLKSSSFHTLRRIKSSKQKKSSLLSHCARYMHRDMYSFKIATPWDDKNGVDSQIETVRRKWINFLQCNWNRAVNIFSYTIVASHIHVEFLRIRGSGCTKWCTIHDFWYYLFKMVFSARLLTSIVQNGAHYTTFDTTFLK